MIKLLSSSFRNIAATRQILSHSTRSLSTSQRLCLKEIIAKQEGDTLIIEGVHVKSPREDRLVKTESKLGACVLCTLDLDVKHTDILILKQFMDHNGKLFPRYITGLCRWQQRKMQYMIEMATRAGLINSLLPPDEPIPDYQKGWRKYNTYYDESEIRPSKSEYAIMKRREEEEAYRIAKAEYDAHEKVIEGRRQARRAQATILLNK